MKFTLASILGTSLAVKLNDGPAFGLAQVRSSACNQAGNYFGIACENNFIQFASGMNGDEDLAQDIIMKGDKFHYQQALREGKAKLDDCTYNDAGEVTNGPVDTNCSVPNNDGGLMQRKSKLDDCTYNDAGEVTNGPVDTNCSVPNNDGGLMQRKSKLEACEYNDAAEPQVTNGPEGVNCTVVDSPGGLVQVASALPKCTWDADGVVENGPAGTNCKLPICNGTNGSTEAGTCRASLAQMALAQLSWNPVVVATTLPLPECHGNNGPDGVNCARPICNGTNGPLDGHVGVPCTREEPAAIPHYNTDPLAGRPYQTSGDESVTSMDAATPVVPGNAAGASAGGAEGGLPPMASGSK